MRDGKSMEVTGLFITYKIVQVTAQSDETKLLAVVENLGEARATRDELWTLVAYGVCETALHACFMISQ